MGGFLRPVRELGHDLLVHAPLESLFYEAVIPLEEICLVVEAENEIGDVPRGGDRPGYLRQEAELSVNAPICGIVGVLVCLLEFSHFGDEVAHGLGHSLRRPGGGGLHFGDRGGEGVFPFLYFCKLFIEGGNIVFAALNDGGEDLGGLLRAVRELLNEALVDAELHRLFDVHGVGVHIGHLALKGLNEAVYRRPGFGVHFLEGSDLGVNALSGGGLRGLIGAREGLGELVPSRGAETRICAF